MLLQYLDLLTTTETAPLLDGSVPTISHGIFVQNYEEKVLPTLAELCRDYGISLPICMLIFRPLLQFKVLVRLSAPCPAVGPLKRAIESGTRIPGKGTHRQRGG